MTKAFRCDECKEYYQPYRFKAVKRNTTVGPVNHTSSHKDWQWAYAAAKVRTSPNEDGVDLDLCQACILRVLTDAIDKENTVV